MNRSQTREFDRQLRALLGEVDAGRMDASDVERAWLSGAAAAVGVVLGVQRSPNTGRPNPGVTVDGSA